MSLPVAEIEKAEPTYAELCERIEAMETKLNALIELLGSVKSQLDPTLTAIAKSPIGRMFGMNGESE